MEKKVVNNFNWSGLDTLPTTFKKNKFKALIKTMNFKNVNIWMKGPLGKVALFLFFILKFKKKYLIYTILPLLFYIFTFV